MESSLRVHLEGMGLGGALLAHRLKQYGVPFTWHDIDAPLNAWRASTGAIYPAGAKNHGPDEEAFKVWQAWYAMKQFAPAHLERSLGFVFCTKNPPHKGAYEHEAYTDTGLRKGPPSYHLNAQAFVSAMRNECHKERLDPIVAGPNGDVKGVDAYIVTHGWGDRLHHVYWGWTRLVKLHVNTVHGDTIPLVGERPAFYLRPNRFEMAYAYPVPGTDWYYAGSSIIKQGKERMRDLNPVDKYRRWKDIFLRESKGALQIGEESTYLTGWRPAAAEEDTAWVKVRRNVITLRPLWNSGIRHFPKQWEGVAHVLGLVP